jgi:hypothetical protein
MPFTRLALVSVWLLVLGLFVVAASGTIAARDGLMCLVLAGLVTPGIILTLTARLRAGAVPVAAGPIATPYRPDSGSDGDRR